MLLGAKKQFSSAFQFVSSARGVWQPNKLDALNGAEAQLQEALYLEGLIRRLEWRLNSAGDSPDGRKNRPVMNDALGNEFGALLYDACVNILTVTKGAVYV